LWCKSWPRQSDMFPFSCRSKLICCMQNLTGCSLLGGMLRMCTPQSGLRSYVGSARTACQQVMLLTSRDTGLQQCAVQQSHTIAAHCLCL
jgi:hypothetical protein